MSRKRSKRHKRKKRARAPSRTPTGPSKKVRLRRRWLLILVLLGGAAGVYAYDRGGAKETIPAQVVDVRTYPHTPRGGESHMHTDAVIEYEGTRHTLERADSLARDEWVEVDIRRGRLSGWAHFESFRGSVSIDLTQPGGELPEPWQYDTVMDRHWDPAHGHWHEGAPPSQRR